VKRKGISGIRDGEKFFIFVLSTKHLNIQAAGLFLSAIPYSLFPIPCLSLFSIPAQKPLYIKPVKWYILSAFERGNCWILPSSRRIIRQDYSKNHKAVLGIILL